MLKDAILDCEYTVMYDDINNDLEMTNVALLRYLEEPGGVQTRAIFNNIVTPKGAWILLNWKVKKIKDLHWCDKFKIRTWPARHTGPFSIRNYEIYNENGELTAVASSKWVLVDTKTQKIVRDIEDVISRYTEYDKMVFEEDFPKLKEPCNIEFSYKHTAQRRDIDTNGHINNVKYLEIAYEALPKEVYDNRNFKNIDIMYKNSAFLGEEVNVAVEKQIVDESEQYTIVTKTNDKLNAIIRLS